ncbi:MAG: sel1 repeat family protein [Pseudomonadota bacterium]|nr:sel1 repeat family protein [Pseudomonadota bacterium]
MHNDNEPINDYDSIVNKALEGDSLAFWQLEHYINANTQQAKSLFTKLNTLLTINPKNANALTLLGQLYRRGCGVEKNYLMAIHYFQQGSKLNNSQATTYLASMYEEGEGHTVDHHAATKLYDQAIKQNNSSAMCALGHHHFYGKGGNIIDYAKAIAYYDQAIRHGHPEAMNNRAFMHLHGLGGKIDHNAATMLFDNAVGLGHYGATLNRIFMHQNGFGGEVDWYAANALCDRFKWQLNRVPDKSLGGYVQNIARHELFYVLPEPTPEDSGYAKFYNTINAMHTKILLGHRFEIVGSAKEDEIEFNLHGGYPQVMIPEVSRSFKEFAKRDSDNLIKEILQNSSYMELGDTTLNAVLQQVCQDMEGAILKPTEDIKTHIHNKAVLLLAPCFQPPGLSTWHTFSLAFFKNMCITIDRSRQQNQIEILESHGDTDDLLDAKRAITLNIVNTMYNFAPNDNPITNHTLFEIFKSMHMRKTQTLSTKPQYGDVCSWVCAKSLLFSTLYFRLYSAAKEIPATDSDAKKLALEYSRKIYHAWSDQDRYDCLNAFIRQYDDPNKKNQGPDPLLLAYIYLKYQHRAGKERFIQLIDDTKLLDDSHFIDASKIAYKVAYQRVEQSLQKESPNIARFFTEADIQVIAEKLAELYMISGKKTIEEAYGKIFQFTFFPVKNAIKILDQAIEVAKSNLDQPPTSENQKKPKNDSV